jgi:hypothetical protein
VDTSRVEVITGSTVAQQDIIFKDREESEFYAQCVRDFLFRYAYELLENKEIIELGVGTGETIAELLRYHSFTGKIRGYEIDPASYDCACQLIDANSVSDRYMVIKGDFFQAVHGSALGGCAISNPPYLPALDPPLHMAELWGGHDGSSVTKRIIECGFECLVLLVPSFSNPVSIINFAASRGYRVLDFAARTMRFGVYTNEPKVRERIAELSKQGEAFVSADRYCIAGVAWVKGRGIEGQEASDLSAALAKTLTSLAAA